MTFSYDDFLGGRIRLKQETGGYRATSDAIAAAAGIDWMKPDASVLDVGSGTGAVALCLASRFPHVRITGVEVQEKSVRLAEGNAELNGMSDRVRFVAGDIMDRDCLKNEAFDYVVTNPPFMGDDIASPDASRDKTRRQSDEALSLWLDFCIRRLKPKGELSLIYKPEKLVGILSVLACKTGSIKIYPIHSKASEPAKKVVIHAVKGSRGKLEVLPSLVLHDAGGAVNRYAAFLQKDGESLKKVLQKYTKDIDRDSKPL